MLLMTSHLLSLVFRFLKQCLRTVTAVPTRFTARTLQMLMTTQAVVPHPRRAVTIN